jgi:hypothetical protein
MDTIGICLIILCAGWALQGVIKAWLKPED